ncbi:hypothetical protein M422DRAFT_73814 [Sphaerobolus stellatus SS14]|nr:hypothetical protein M422DRAFT_73814 [Sphaerobolus stellatus SS14]
MELSQSPIDKQREEIQVLKSILGAEDFLPAPPKSNAWKVKGPPEFMLRVRHPDPECTDAVGFNLHVAFTLKYPATAPILKIQKPISGLSQQQLNSLLSLLQKRAKDSVGNAMIYDLYDFCLDWLRDNVKLAKIPTMSLAGEMTHRTAQEEEALQVKREAEKDLRRQEEEKQLEQLSYELNLDSIRKKETQRVERQKARKRAMSDVEEPAQTVEVPVESFKEKIQIYCPSLGEDVEFDSVMIFNPIAQYFGTTWQAEPVCDAPRGSLLLDLHIISFDGNYYGSTKGRQKLDDLEKELRIQMGIKHPNIVAIHAVKLSMNYPPRLAILSERRMGMSLQDLLQAATSLNAEKATIFLRQCLSALNALHDRGLLHKGINLTTIRVANTTDSLEGPIIKMDRAFWYPTVRDLHRSNSFGDFRSTDGSLPESWTPKEVIESPLIYTRTRDISELGIVFLRMLLGINAARQHPDPFTAMDSDAFPDTLRDLTTAMWDARKRRTTSCLSLLNNLPVVNGPTIRPNITITSPSVLKLGRKFWPGRSPEKEIAPISNPRSHGHSRWREDWDELEHLGSGGFGRVVKARNRLDGRIYAVKKIKLLRSSNDDEKIFREVKLLSRLQHRHIVRYYTTWLETEGVSSDSSDADEDDTSDASSEQTSRQHTDDDDPFAIDLDELSSNTRSQSTSFPSIHFKPDSSGRLSSLGDSDSESDDESGSLSPALSRYTEKPPVLPGHRILYIQMEFVERQTLVERIAEGLSEDEAWRLFHQLLEGLSHMASLGILHRDIKCGNIFIDKNGDVKIGDFGLATSSLATIAAKETSDGTFRPSNPEMTLDIGTRLYTAPEVLGSGSRRSHDHTKADMYSLGIVFFEMNFSFSTQSERITVLESLRKPAIIFPSAWQGRSRQKEIITSLLQHDPAARPSAQELSQSPLLPPKVQDEYIRDALHVMTQRGSVHYSEILNSFFNQEARPTAFVYDRDFIPPTYAPLLPIIQDRLVEIFRMHGAIDSTLPLLLPKAQREEYGPNTVFLVDRQGELLTLPRNGLIPMARRAAQHNIRRIKRYHIGDVYSNSMGGGHPSIRKAAVVDVITPDLSMGAQPAIAELLGIADRCLNAFPVSEFSSYVIHITHTDIKKDLFNRIPASQRSYVHDILYQSKTPWRTKRGHLVKSNVGKSILDEIEVLCEADDLELLVANIQKVSMALYSTLAPAIDEVRQIIRYAKTIGVTRPILFRPLMDAKTFESGVFFQFVRPSRRSELIAAGGRYDHLIRKYADPTAKLDTIRAFGLQIDVDRVATHLAAHQSTSVSHLIKEQRSFGAFSPRRCDVYIYSFQPGHLAERLEVAALLWKHNISADIMYDAAINNEEDHVQRCFDEGILFIVYPKPPTARHDQPTFKVKSVIRETETGVSRHELVSFLQSQIAEQRKIDVESTPLCIPASPLTTVSTQTINEDVQLVLLQDVHRKLKKPPKGIKDALNPAKEKISDLVYTFSNSFRHTVQHGLPIIAVDIPSLAFNAMIADAEAGWLTNDEAWRTVLAAMPEIPSGRAVAIKDALLKKKEEGKRHVILFHVQDERAFVLNF